MRLLTWSCEELEFAPDDLVLNAESLAMTWHETLGVDPEADAADVRRAMAKLANVLHPDKGGDHALMQRVNLAFAEFKASRRKMAA